METWSGLRVDLDGDLGWAGGGPEWRPGLGWGWT